MNITISKTSALRGIALLAALALLVWGGNWALSNGFPARWQRNPAPASQDQPALQAVTAIYSSDPAAEKSAWESTVCSGMTAQGCSLFKAMYAPAIWAVNSQKNEKKEATATFLEVVETLADETQIWKVSIALEALPADIYIQVEAEPESGQWLLDRILFTQEAAKYAK